MSSWAHYYPVSALALVVLSESVSDWCLCFWPVAGCLSRDISPPAQTFRSLHFCILKKLMHIVRRLYAKKCCHKMTIPHIILQTFVIMNYPVWACFYVCGMLWDSGYIGINQLWVNDATDELFVLSEKLLGSESCIVGTCCFGSQSYAPFLFWSFKKTVSLL